MGRYDIFIEGLGGASIVEKLVRGGVPLLAASVQKKGVVVRVDGKHRKKVFAILRGSCYNEKKVSPAGGTRLVHALVRRAGALVGALLFCAGVLCAEQRVLRIEVVGSGAYFREEVVRILAREGVDVLSPPPARPASVAAHIVALPRVSFCSLSHAGGVLTVRVEVAEEATPLAGRSLLLPASGTVTALTVLSGRACVAVGDVVTAGAVAVENVSPEGASPVPVIASVTVEVAVDREYAGLDERAALAAALLEYGEGARLHSTRTESGARVTGTASVTAALNLG